MANLKIKICGIKTNKEIKLCKQLKINLIGINLYNHSKRYIKNLHTIKTTHPKLIGILINPTLNNFKQLKTAHIKLIQINHNWKNLKPARNTIISFNITQQINKHTIKKINTHTLTPIIIDSHTPQMGGCNKKFNWQLIDTIKKPYLLAGGVNIYNLWFIIVNYKPYGIDIASGSENNYKKCIKLIQTIQQTRNEIQIPK